MTVWLAVLLACDPARPVAHFGDFAVVRRESNGAAVAPDLSGAEGAAVAHWGRERWILAADRVTIARELLFRTASGDQVACEAQVTAPAAWSDGVLMLPYPAREEQLMRLPGGEVVACAAVIVPGEWTMTDERGEGWIHTLRAAAGDVVLRLDHGDDPPDYPGQVKRLGQVTP